MSNEAQYFSPIVSAMMDVVKTKQQQQQFEQAKEQFAKTQDIEKMRQQTAQQLADTHEKQVENEREYNKSMISHYHDLLQASNDVQQTNKIGTFQKFLENGGSPEAANLIPGMSYQPGAMPLPQGTQLPPGTQPGPGPQVSITGQNGQTSSAPAASLYNPQTQADRIRQVASAQSGGTAEGQLPFAILADERARQAEKAKQDVDWQHKLSELALTGQNSENVTRIHNAGMAAEANINNAGRLKNTMLMHQFGMDDGSGIASTYAHNLTNDIFDGQADYSKLTSDQKRLVDNYAAASGERGLPTNGKDYSDKIGTVTGLQALVNQYRDLAQNYSKDSPGGGPMQMLQHGQFGLVPTSDLNSKLDTAKASGGALATFFDKQNRKSDAEILRQTKGFFDPTATTAQNLQKINTQTGLLQQGVRNVFSGMTPDRVNLILKDHGVTDFGGFTQPPPGQTAPQDVIGPDKSGTYWKYKGTGDRNIQSNFDPIPKGGQ